MRRSLAGAGALAAAILDEVERAVVGKREALELVLLGLLADGHVLLEDYPGLAKTLAARSFAQVTSIGFTRIQFTPDLMPSDVTGSSIWNQRDADFEFRPGPIFTNLLLADEINRAPPKTQAALLEAMQERQVTIEGIDAPARAAVPRARDAEPDRVRGHVPAARGAARPLPAAGRLRLPDARATSGRCSRAGSSAARTRSSSSPWSTGRRCSRCRRRSSSVHVGPSVGRYIVELVAATRASGSTAGRRQPARQPRAAEARRAAAPRSPAATSSRPTTSRRSPCRRSRTG